MPSASVQTLVQSTSSLLPTSSPGAGLPHTCACMYILCCAGIADLRRELVTSRGRTSSSTCGPHCLTIWGLPNAGSCSGCVGPQTVVLECRSVDPSSNPNPSSGQLQAHVWHSKLKGPCSVPISSFCSMPLYFSDVSGMGLAICRHGCQWCKTL